MQKTIETLLQNHGYSPIESGFVSAWIMRHGLCPNALSQVVEVFRKARDGRSLRVEEIFETFKRYCGCWSQQLPPSEAGNIDNPIFGEDNKNVFYMVYHDLRMPIPKEFMPIP